MSCGIASVGRILAVAWLCSCKLRYVLFLLLLTILLFDAFFAFVAHVLAVACAPTVAVEYR